MNESLTTLLDAAREVGGAAWPILVRREYVEALVVCGGSALGLVVACVCALIVRRAWDDADADYCGIALVSGALIFIFSIVGLLSYLPALIFPEGAALAEVMDAAGRL